MADIPESNPLLGGERLAPIKTARIHSVFGGYSVLMDGKRFLFAENHSDVEEMDKLLNHLGFVTAITYNTDKGVRLV